jgi:hypothetical protein
MIRRDPSNPDDTHNTSTASSDPNTLEVHLEELGQHSWMKALFNTLSGSYGSAQFRFVAHPPGDVHDSSDDVAVGATFPVMRLQDLNNRTQPNAWIDIAEQRLQELDRELTDAGWARADRTGPHWWSVTYSKPSTET